MGRRWHSKTYLPNILKSTALFKNVENIHMRLNIEVKKVLGLYCSEYKFMTI